MAKKSSAHTLEYILLGLIREEPAHGYMLFERIKNSPELSRIWQVKRGKLYYLLDKLEAQGLLASSISSQESLPDRKIYQLTAPGMELLKDWLTSPVLHTRYVRLAFLSKLYFAIQDSGSSVDALVKAQISVCRRWLENLDQKMPLEERNTFLTQQIYQFRQGQIQAMLDWLLSLQENLPDNLPTYLSIMEEPSP